MKAPEFLLCAMLAAGCSASERPASELERQIKKPGIDERRVASYGPERDGVYWAARGRVARLWFPEGMLASEAVALLKQQGFTVEQIVDPRPAAQGWPSSDWSDSGDARVLCGEALLR